MLAVGPCEADELLQGIWAVLATLRTSMADARQGRKSTAKKCSPKTETGSGKTVKAKLQRAVQREVSKNSEKLAKVLVEKAAAGSSSSASIMLRMLDNQIKEEQKTAEQEMEHQRPSAAEQLANEEEWAEVKERRAGVDSDASARARNLRRRERGNSVSG